MRRRLSTAVCGVLLGASPAVAVQAQAATGVAPSGDRPVQHCVVVLEALQRGQNESRIVHQECANSPAAFTAAATAQSTLLMTWYSDANYFGSSTTVRGKNGPCDREGYGFNDIGGFFGAWNDTISSFKTYNNCNRARAYKDIEFRGGWQSYDGYFHPWVGENMNDQISSFQVWNG